MININSIKQLKMLENEVIFKFVETQGNLLDLFHIRGKLESLLVQISQIMRIYLIRLSLKEILLTVNLHI